MSSRASLNHVYRTVWNQALGAMVAVAETDSAGGCATGARIRTEVLQRPGGARLGMLALSVALAWSAMAPTARANPTGGVAVAGSATFVNSGNKLQVTTQNAAGTNHSAINWQSFSIPAGSSTYFLQPTASSTSINRVVTNTPTQIFGTLSSNGNLVLVNQAGIAVGNGAVVDTNGFTASSLAMTDADAMAGRLRFGDGQISTAGISVGGNILARNGDAVLIGSNVNTSAGALVQAPNGSTILAAGQQVEITGRGLEGIRLQVQAPSDAAVNLGALSGDAVGMFAGTLRHSGQIQATMATLEGGRVVLKSSGDAYVEGHGTINATGVTGGSVDVLGQRVALTDQASIDVSGQNGGGSIRVGGDYQGGNAAIGNAAVTYFGKEASLNANAVSEGNGGRVIVWADDVTRAYGTITARGGASGGNGGFVETSGHNYLDFQGRVDTGAAHGKAGTLLLDPTDITIDNSSYVPNGGSIVGGIFSGATGNSVLTWATINGQSGSMEIRTNTGGTGGSGDITVGASGSITGPSTLTLLANRNLSVSPSVAINGGSADINLVSGWNNSGYAVTDGTGSITFGSGSSLSTSGNVWMNAGYAISAGSAAITANTLTVGNTNGNSIQGGAVFSNSNTVSTLAGIVQGGGALIFGNNQALQIGTGANSIAGVTAGNAGLTVTTSSGGLTVAQPILSGAGVTLTGYGNVVFNAGLSAAGSTVNVNSTQGTVTQNTGVITAGILNVTAPSGIVIGDVTTTGNLQLTATGGTVVQSGYGTLAVGGTTSVTAVGAINLGNSANDFTGALSTSGYGSNVTLNDANNLVLGAMSGVNNLSVTTNGALTQTGALTVGGTTYIDTCAGAITLTDSGNQFTGAVSVNTDVNASVRTANSLVMGTSYAGGALNIQAGGSISQTGSGITANSLGVTLNGGMNLNNTNNMVNTLSVVNSPGTNQVTYWNDGPLTLGAITTGGSADIHIYGGGSVTQSAPLTVGGTMAVNANNGGGYGAIVLMNASNDFGTVDMTGLSVQVKDSNALNVYNVYVNGPGAGASLIQSGGAMSLAGGTLSSSASGDAIKLISGGTFSGYGGNIYVSGGARWLAYLGTPGSETFPANTPPQFKQYNAVNGSTVLGTGSGVLYSTAPTLTASVTGAVTKVYDGSTSIPSTGAVVGAVSGTPLGLDDISSATGSLVSATLADPNVGTGKAVTFVGSVNGVVGGYGDPIWAGLPIYGYGFTPNANIGAVTPARAVATISGSGMRVYDGTNIVNASIFTLSGLVGGETLNLSGSGTMVDKNVGTNKPVNPSGLSLGDGTGLASNYTLTGGTFTATITPLAISSVNGVTMDTRAYNGSVNGTVNTSTASLGGTFANDVVSLSGIGATGAYADRHAGTGKPATVTNLSLAGGDAGNYSLPITPIAATGTVTPLAVTSISGLTATKVYDGDTKTPIDTSGAVLNGALKGDAVSLSGNATGDFEDRSVGTGKKIVSVTLPGLALAGADAGDYSLSSKLTVSASTGNITQLQNVTWRGGATGNWNTASNWTGNALPDGNNVATVTIPANVTVNYDGGTTQLSSLSAGNLAISGGSLTVGTLPALTSYTQTGGSLTSSGGLTVNGAYNQSGGSVSVSGPVSATQTSGNLLVGTMAAPAVTLAATSGAIGQSGPLTVSGLLTTQSTTGTVLNDVGNHVGAYTGTNSGAGNIAFTTTGAVTLQGMNTSNGNVTVNNFGGIHSVAAIVANGSVALTANSPLTIDAPINATGNIDLVATNKTSAGNITINGPVNSSGGSVAMAAAGNYVQNSAVSAALGVSATSGGTMSFGPGAVTTGHPVNFDAAGSVVIPPGSTPTVGSTPTDFVASFMSNFENTLVAQNSSTADPGDKKKDKDVVVEGQSCTR